MRSTASQGACPQARRKIHCSTRRKGNGCQLVLAEYQAATRDLFFNRSNLRYGIRRGAGVGRSLGVEVVRGAAVGVTVGRRCWSSAFYRPNELEEAHFELEAARLAAPSKAPYPPAAARVLPSCARVRYDQPVVPEPLTGRREIFPRLHRHPVSPFSKHDWTCQRD